MSDVSDLFINETKTKVSWNYAGNRIQIIADDIGQAVEDIVHEKIIVSLCKGEYPYQIKVFDVTGEELLSFGEPKPFEFYYLKQHSTFGVSIICTTEEPVDGRMDWQFEIDYKKGELKRSAPSY
jgi:hypothetical protein